MVVENIRHHVLSCEPPPTPVELLIGFVLLLPIGPPRSLLSSNIPPQLQEVLSVGNPPIRYLKHLALSSSVEKPRPLAVLRTRNSRRIDTSRAHDFRCIRDRVQRIVDHRP